MFGTKGMTEVNPGDARHVIWARDLQQNALNKNSYLIYGAFFNHDAQQYSNGLRALNHHAD